MERHDTHALSGYSSSSNNHSYDFENKKKNKNNKKLISRNIQDGLNEQLTSIQLKKINSILNKYNIHSEQTPKNVEFIKHRQKTDKEEEINLNRNILISKNNTGENHTSSTKNKKKESKKEKKKKKSKSQKDIIINNDIDLDEPKKEEIKIEEPKKEETKKENEEPKIEEFREKRDKKDKKEKLKYSISYRNVIRDTTFNNIQKFIDDENKRKIKLKKIDSKNKLLVYKPVNIQGNLVRTIKKPTISFITKIFKNFYEVNNNQTEKEEIPGLLLSIKNNYCFCTKQYVKSKEYSKKIKITKKNKEEINDEKIPTFSSINTSSSNSLYGTKSKSKNKKKQIKNKTKIKSKNITKKKQTLFSKNIKPQRSISVYSKVSKEKSEDGKKSLSKKKTFKVLNMKKKQPYVSEKKLKGVNRNIRKYSVVNRYRGKFSNIQNDNIEKKNSNNNINNNNNNNINNNDNEKLKINININKEKENKEIDFKNFLEQQRLKKDKQIKNYIKKNGINSYNFFYPKEPSPLLSTFKNKYNIYTTLNIERKNSVDMGINNNVIINNRQFYKITYRPKKGKSFYEKDNIKKGFNNIDNKDLNNHNNLHLVDKHFGLEIDCPLCRAFQMKKLKDNYNTMNYIKSMKYTKMRIDNKKPRILSPNSFGFINGSEKEYSSLSRNRNTSGKYSEYIDEYSQIKRNFFVLFDYFN